MLKGQDIVVLAALMDGENAEETYAELGMRVCLSASETHAAVRRLQDAMLVSGARRLFKRNVLEFLAHGLRYAFPFRPAGTMARGLATSYAAPVAEGSFAATGMNPVWSHSSGNVYGQAFEPLYATAPRAAANNRKLYDRLAVLDMLRGGRLRERQFAERKLSEFIR